MKKNLLFFLLFVSSCLSAQVELVWSEYLKPLDYGKYIIGAKNGHLYSVNVENDIVYLVSYSEEDMKPETYKELVVGKGAKIGGKAKKYTREDIDNRKKDKKNRDYNYERFYIIKDKVFIIYYTKEKKIKTYYAQTYDLEGSPVDAVRELEQFEERRWSTSHYFGLSQDSSMIYMFRQPKADKDDNDKFIVKIWDTNLETLNNVEIEMPYENRNADMYDYYLTSDKKLVALYKIYIPKKERQKDDPEVLVKAMNIDIADGSVKDFEMNLKDVFIRDLNLRFDEDQNAYCVGTFSKAKRRANADGTFFYKLDYKTGEISAEHSQEFSTEIIHKMNNSESKKKRNQDLRANIDLRQVIAKPDGGSYVLFEENYIVVVTTRSSNGATSTTYYYYDNDILIMNVSPEGEIIWQNVIPKKQVSTNDGGAYNSFYATQYNNNLYIFYNEDYTNYKEGKYEYMCNPTMAKSSIPVMVTMTEDGTYETTGIITYDKKRDYIMSFRDADRMGKNKAIVYARHTKKACCSAKAMSSEYRIGRMTIE
ncbi:MAG: hypothetical protein RLZZ543_1948 [Bacteroidota bacterium]|jgi:hypothetical protein